MSEFANILKPIQHTADFKINSFDHMGLCLNGFPFLGFKVISLYNP